MRILGIDPGLDESHGVLLTPVAPAAATAYGHVAQLVSTIKGSPETIVSQACTTHPDLVLVEVARDGVASERAADPILHVNIIAGEILGRLAAAGICAVPVASGGSATHWNWRSSLGVKGVKGPAARDALCRQITTIRTANPDAYPVGPRGGVITHYHDAAGIAFAGLDRVLASPALTPLDAINRVTPYEKAQLQQRTLRKTAARVARRAQAPA